MDNIDIQHPNVTSTAVETHEPMEFPSALQVFQKGLGDSEGKGQKQPEKYV